MKDSVSFNVDHSKPSKGIYLSKTDSLGDVKTIKLNFRMNRVTFSPMYIFKGGRS